MPGKTARALCPVCQEPMPPDETECDNCGAFVIDEAVVRLCRALGIPREKALALFEKGFRSPKQLQDRDVDDVLRSGENGLLFLCTNCGGFVATGDPKCPRCGAEFEAEPTPPLAEKDILDITLCPVCGADNEATWKECEICGEPLGGTEEPPGEEAPPASATAAEPAAPETPPGLPPSVLPEKTPTLEQIDDILEELDRPEAAPEESQVRRVSKRVKVPKRSKVGPAPHPQAAVPPPPVEAPERVAPRPVARPRKPALRPVPRPVPPAHPAAAARPGPVPPPGLPASRIASRTPRRPPSPRRMARQWDRAPLPLEATAGLIVAAAGSLYLSNVLHQTSLVWTITIVAAALVAYVVAAAGLRRILALERVDLFTLLAGAGLSIAAPALHQTLAPVLSVSGAVALAFATRRLVHSGDRDLIVAASGLPLVALALIAALGYAFADSAAWTFGLLALAPWPAAVAAEGVRQRRSGLLLGRELTKAETHLGRAEYAASVQAFDRAIAVTGKGTPGAETPWYGKGASLILMGRYEEALRAIDKALDLNPQNEVAWLNKGNALTRMGRLADALRCFNAAIQVNPRYEVAWNNKGNTLARLGRHEEALTCYDRAIEIDPGYRGAWVNKGYVLTKMGRYDEATSCADRALRLHDRARAETT